MVYLRTGILFLFTNEKISVFFFRTCIIAIFDLMQFNITQHCSVQLACFLGGQAYIRLASSKICFGPPMWCFLFETQDLRELLVAFVVLQLAARSPGSMLVVSHNFCFLSSPHESLC